VDVDLLVGLTSTCTGDYSSYVVTSFLLKQDSRAPDIGKQAKISGDSKKRRDKGGRICALCMSPIEALLLGKSKDEYIVS
jgi:hypothetical protein